MQGDSTALARTEAAEVSPMGMIQQALSTGTSPEVIRELVALQQSMERFSWEREERQAKIDFDDALNACQQQIGRIAPNRKRENDIWWADYCQLDKAVRPIYLAAGFSIGYSEVEIADKGMLKMCATLSKSGVSRDYFAEISRSAPNSKMSAADAGASAASRVKRYLLIDIFNIAIGIDKDEKKPFQQAGAEMDQKDFATAIEHLEAAPDMRELNRIYLIAQEKAAAAKDSAALLQFSQARDKRRREITNG
jgi:hypothetical protein